MKQLSPNATTYTAVFLIAMGLILIFLGWNGAASLDAALDLRAQFPYLLSGGLFGLSLVGAGLVLVRVFEGRRDSKEVVAHLERLTLAVERLEQARMAEQLAAANLRDGVPVAPGYPVPGYPAPVAYGVPVQNGAAAPTGPIPHVAPPAAPPFEQAQ